MAEGWVPKLGETEAERLTRLRGDIFAVLRAHDVCEQCFAEVAMLTHAAITKTKRTPIAGE